MLYCVGDNNNNKNLLYCFSLDIFNLWLVESVDMELTGKGSRVYSVHIVDTLASVLLFG